VTRSAGPAEAVATMARPAMRRLINCLVVIAFLLVAGLLLPAPVLDAQEPSGATLSLVSQSPWSDASRPLNLTVRATNESATPLESLKVVLIIHAPARSRSVYELSLTEDATSVLLAYPFPQEGVLEPGESREFSISQPLEVLQGLGESAIYPLTVELTAADVPLATLRSPLIFLVEPPEVPLNLAWTWVLSSPIQFRPDGVFLPGALEADVAPGGRLDALVGAIERAGRRRLDLVVSSALAAQLDRMAGGYRILDPDGTIRSVDRGEAGAADAEALLSRLRRIAARRGVEVVAYPFGDPRLPALIRAGLAGDVPLLYRRGSALAESVLGKAPNAEVVRPPLSQLDLPSMTEVQEMGGRVLLVDRTFLRQTEEPAFSPPAVIRLQSESTSMAAVTPDPKVVEVAAGLREDPILAAHAALGELAATWLELPGTPGRGAALLFAENPGLPIATLDRFSGLVRRSPWLKPVTASRFVALVPEQPEPQPLPAKRYPAISQGYVGRLLRGRSAVAEFDQTARGARALIDRLKERLLLAEGGTSVAEPLLGQAFIDSVHDEIARVYSGVTIQTTRLTLASQSGTIPITFSNQSEFPMSVLLRFQTDRRLQFVEGASRRIVLPAVDEMTLTFAVRAQTTGQIPFTIRLVTSGPSINEDTIAEATMVIRSTAYNRVALFFTIGAALFLLVWWGRRFLPRRTR
jgi:hypothetical protein